MIQTALQISEEKMKYLQYWKVLQQLGRHLGDKSIPHHNTRPNPPPKKNQTWKYNFEKETIKVLIGMFKNSIRVKKAF